MPEEIVKDGPIQTDRSGRKWLPVLISNEALSMINKTILGDQEDDDNTKRIELRNQVHNDCLRLFKEFN